VVKSKKAIRDACYLSVPVEYDVAALSRALEEQNIKPIVPTDIPFSVGSSVDHVTAAIRACDLFLAVLDETSNPSRYFEIGIAYSLQKRMLIVLPYSGASEFPFSFSELPVIRIAPDNYEEIAASLAQIHKHIKRSYRRASYSLKPSRPVRGTQYENLLHEVAQLEERSRRKDPYTTPALERDIAKIVSSAIKLSGVSVVSEPRLETPALGRKTHHPDLAIWSDELHSTVGNPFLIEVKRTLKSPKDVRAIVDQIAGYIGENKTSWVLLLYLEGPEALDDLSSVPPNILTLKIESFVRMLRDKSFADIVRNLRNQKVHGFYM
jgi:hypothetical protein